MQHKRVLGIIPARAGSKRIPGKNRKLLAGKELVRYSIEAALQARFLTDVVVSSDDPQILKIATEYAGVLALERPSEISGDTALAITFVNHALGEIDKVYDAVAIIQPSSPFTLGSDIDSTINLLSPEVKSAVSVMKLDHAIHPYKLKVMEGTSLIPYLEEEQGRMAAHEMPDIYVRNGSVYVSTIDLIASGKIIGEVCSGYVMPRERSIDINDELDFKFAEFMKQEDE